MVIIYEFFKEILTTSMHVRMMQALIDVGLT